MRARLAACLLMMAAILPGCSATDATPSEAPTMTTSITPFLMFQDGRAEEAMQRYVELFPGGTIISIVRWAVGEPGGEGTIKTAIFEVAGQRIMCSDSPPVHAFSFTPSISMFVEFDSADEHNRVFTELSDGGQVLMPPDNYGFSQRFAWVQDRYGISWQLNLNLPAK